MGRPIFVRILNLSHIKYARIKLAAVVTPSASWAILL